MNIQSLIDNQLTNMTALRHRLHQIPELSYQEFKTAAMIRSELDRLGIEHVDGVAGAPTATIAMIGEQSKPCIAFRADIDALPIIEQTGLSYTSSHHGSMHACGHDGHTAILLGLAAVFKEIAPELPVCVKLIWQPAEEGGAGAEKLVHAGVLDGRIGPPVQAIFGLHGWPDLPVGAIGTKAGALLASTDTFKATFIGKGCHGAYPHKGVDPIVTACEAVLNLQQAVSREVDPTDSVVITVGIFNAGTAVNIIPDTATIAGTARTLNERSRTFIKESIKRRVQGIADANHCELQFVWEEGYPSTINDPTMADYVAKTAQAIFGADQFIAIQKPSMGGEDFAYYLQKVPGCFFVLGVKPNHKTTYPSLHNNRYDFTDTALKFGLQMFVHLAKNYDCPSTQERRT